MNALIFEIEKQKFAISTDKVYEIVPKKRVTWIPNSPEEVLGMIDIRDEIITVLDTSKILNVAKKSDENKECEFFIIVEINDRKQILTADNVSTITELTEEVSAERDIFVDNLIDSIYQLDNDLIMLISLSQLGKKLKHEDYVEELTEAV